MCAQCGPCADSGRALEVDVRTPWRGSHPLGAGLEERVHAPGRCGQATVYDGAWDGGRSPQDGSTDACAWFVLHRRNSVLGTPGAYSREAPPTDTPERAPLSSITIHEGRPLSWVGLEGSRGSGYRRRSSRPPTEGYYGPLREWEEGQSHKRREEEDLRSANPLPLTFIRSGLRRMGVQVGWGRAQAWKGAWVKGDGKEAKVCGRVRWADVALSRDAAE